MKTNCHTYSLIVFTLLFYCNVASAFVPGDTIRAKYIKLTDEKVKYPYQPIVIKTSPTAFLWGGVFPMTAEYRLMVEMPSARKQTEQLGISLLGKSILLKAIEKAAGYQSLLYKVKGWRLQYAHKFFLIGKKKYAPYGFYAAPMVSFTNAKISRGLNRYYKNVYYDVKHFNMNIILGVQGGGNKRLTFDLYFGLGYKNNKISYHYSNNTFVPIDTKDFGILYNSHLNGVFGLNVGYSL